MARGRPTTQAQRTAVFQALQQGKSLFEAAQIAGVSYNTVKMMRAGFGIEEHHTKLRALKIPTGLSHDDRPATVRDVEAQLPGPLAAHELCPEAARALEDFGYFRRRYFGHISTPWQIETAVRLIQMLESDEKEYVVENCPPGTGKTTMLHDIAAWAIVRNRNIRGLFGSRTTSNATRQLLRLRRSLERVFPVRAKPADLAAGTGCDADSTLAHDYGRFRPEKEEVWRADAFIVLQNDDIAITEKEPTWSAYGMDAGVLGNRFEMILWDDLVDRKNTRNVQAAQDLYKLWDEELETRLEPKGLLALVGQRISANDLYRYCLDKRLGIEEEETSKEEFDRKILEDKEMDDSSRRMYKHVKYKAHYDDLCNGTHKDVKPFPEGCLLDPYRLPFKELKAIQTNSPERYTTLYQQEDADPDALLVDPIWISGGIDRHGHEAPGCWDKTRGLWELPRGLARPYVCVITADPSPAKYWSVQAWVYHPETEQRFLLDLVRQRMEAPDLLDWNYNDSCFTGILEDWRQKAFSLGMPIQFLIVEVNAAQRFLLQYEHVKRWQAKFGISVIGHTTGLNKSDPQLGVPTLASHYRFGRVRLPGKPYDGSTLASLKLIDEVTKWPQGRTDDCVMAQWFLEANLWKVSNPLGGKTLQLWRPTWMRNALGVRR